MENMPEHKSDIEMIEAERKLNAVQKLIPAVPSSSDKFFEQTYFAMENGFTIESISNDLPNPTRKKGSISLTAPASFCEYVNKHKNKDYTIIMADRDKGLITAFLNHHGTKEAGWNDFEAHLHLGFSDEWMKWKNNCHNLSKKTFTQTEFVDFLEDNRADLKIGSLIDADGKEVENLSFTALSALLSDLSLTITEEIDSKINLATGDMTLFYQTKEKGKMEVEIPSKLFLAVPIYRNSDLFQVTLRLRRRRLERGGIIFYFMIDQYDLLLERAFSMICERIEKGNKNSGQNEKLLYEGTNLKVLQGVLKEV